VYFSGFVQLRWDNLNPLELVDHEFIVTCVYFSGFVKLRWDNLNPLELVDHEFIVTCVYFSGFVQLRWDNLNPLELVGKMKGSYIDGEAMERVLKDAGVSSGYVEKPCIDPHDTYCPETAPNYQSKQVSVSYVLQENTCRFESLVSKQLHTYLNLVLNGNKSYFQSLSQFFLSLKHIFYI